MTTQERNKAAEKRIKELKTLIKYLKNGKWNQLRYFLSTEIFDIFLKTKIFLLDFKP